MLPPPHELAERADGPFPGFNHAWPCCTNTGDVTLLLSHSQQLLNSQNQAYANLLCWRPPNLFNRLRSRERKKRIERGCFFPPIPSCFSETTLYATIPCLPHKKTTISHFPSSPPAPFLPTSIPHALWPPRRGSLFALSFSVSLNLCAGLKFKFKFRFIGMTRAGLPQAHSQGPAQ